MINQTTNRKPCIHVLALGGTIASSAKKTTEEFYEHPSIAINHLIRSLPLDQDKINVVSEQLFQQISQNMTYDELLFVAQKIHMLVSQDEIDGIVVTQGTNCIEETAYFMNLVINTKKPIIFTGSFRPINALGYDGDRNLYNAILIASNPDAIGIGVVLTFNDYIIAAREASKSNPSIISCFTANGKGIIGLVTGQSICIQASVVKKHTYLSEFSIKDITSLPKTYIIYGHLGMDNIFVDAAIKSNTKGIVSAGMGKGYHPETIVHSLSKAIKKGIFIVRCSRTGQGIVNIDTKIDDQLGTIAGNSLSPQKAVILLAVALSKVPDKNEIQRIFNQY